MEKNQGNAPTQPKHAGGRPTKYNIEIANRICELISTSTVGLYTLCQYTKDLPAASTIRLWRVNHAEFSAQYARAKLAQADLLAEDCLDISDASTPENVGVDRLRVDSRKWLASKLLPKQYGDKLLLEQKTEENEQLKLELLALRAKLDEANKREY